MSFESREKADAVRRKFSFTEKARFPIQEVCVWHGLDVVVDDDPTQRYLDGAKLGLHLGIAHCDGFSAELLVPLWLLEPMCCAKNVKTGERWFFGLFEKKRGYTMQELADIFGAPRWLVKQQIERLL